MDNTIDVRRTIAFLNSLVLIDRHAVQELISQRVGCTTALANHPTVQVSVDPKWVAPGQYRVGLLGILNGLLGVGANECGWIAAEYGDDGVLLCFREYGIQ